MDNWIFSYRKRRKNSANIAQIKFNESNIEDQEKKQKCRLNYAKNGKFVKVVGSKYITTKRKVKLLRYWKKLKIKETKWKQQGKKWLLRTITNRIL